MLTDTLMRLGLAALIILAGLSAYWGWNRWQMRRLGRAAAGPLLGLETRPANTPAVLYFRTPECVVCATAQRPALDRLEADLGSGVHIIEVDAAAQPAVADYWGVLSVPTTFVIDAGGQPRAINHGLTSKDKLKQQILGASAVAAEGQAALELDPTPVRETSEA